MAFFRSRRARSSLLYAPAALASVLATSATRLESSSSADESKPTGPGVEFVGVFVDAASAKALRASYPSKFAAANNANSEDTSPLFVVLKYNPTDKEKEAFAPLAGRTARLHVQGYVEDSETQAVVVRVTTESGDAIEFESVHGANIPHVTLASVNGGQGLNSGYSSVLLERLQADNRLQWVLDANANNDETNNEWAGELPAFESKLLPLFNPFPASPARVTKASSDDVIKGTVCVSSSYDPETGKCVGAPAKAECGFCKFMKAGPCGTEFSAWEACLDRCKQNGLDFIEHCGNETLALRDCVDANPEYYSVLNEPPEDEKESAEAEAEVEAGQS